MVELCIHIANGFYLVSFLVRDILWLRALTCVGLLLGVVFFTCQPAPMYGPTVWHFVFLFINAIQIRRLVVERRQLTLTREQEKVAEATFVDLSRDELLTLLTRVMSENPKRVYDLRHASHKELTPEQQVLRDIAFRGLSRKDMVNLLTRKLWRSFKWLNPTAWKLRRRTIPAGVGSNVPARASVEPVGAFESRSKEAG